LRNACKDAEVRREPDRRYNASEKGRLRAARYDDSEKGRARSSRYNTSAKGRDRQERYDATAKGIIRRVRYDTGRNLARSEAAYEVAKAQCAASFARIGLDAEAFFSRIEQGTMVHT
jgi:hypothetical protein